ncbi:MAG: molybdopterin oxidoreductase family protein [Proteobacteria bacterium]|nr:molybdopterin oxidoreductase family protein [Pseudomonadota bacterium]
MVDTHFRTCSLCEAMCGLKIEHDGDSILSVKGDPDDPHSRGNICPKGVAIQDLHNDPDRLRHPVKRQDGAWVEISWDEALGETARRLVEVQKQYGRNAVASYWGNPSAHNMGTALMIGAFNKSLGTQNVFSATSVDQLPHQFVQYFMYGSSLLFTIPDINRTDYMLMLGANPAVSNGSLWSCGDATKKMAEVGKRGGKIVLIDPRRTETTRYVAEHHFITPGTDAVLLLALLGVIFEKNLADPGRLQQWLKGWELVEPLSKTYSLDQAARITGIAAGEIERMAVEFASAEAAVCYGRFGVSTQEFGALCQWLIQVINIATGNFDRPGGMMFAKPALDLVKTTSRGSHNKFRSRVRGLAEFGRELPVAVMAEEMLIGGEGQVKALVTTAGNPVLSTPNGKRLDDALPNLEFMVSIDFYINETTCHADIILPPTGPLEHEHYDLVFNLFAVRDVAKFSPAMIEPGPDTRSDWQIYKGLVARINRLRGKRPSLKMRLWSGLEKLFPYLASVEFILDLGLRLGPYGKGFVPFAKGLSLARLKRHRHGLDLGALKPALPGRLFTRDKKIDLAPAILSDDIMRLKEKYTGAERGGEANGALLLIGRRDTRTNNSWMHNSLRLVKGKNRCTLLIHPEDAVDHAITDGQPVTITSRTGAIRAVAEITDAMNRGVVSLPHGWGHHRPGISMEVASAHAGVSANDITDELLIDRLSGNASVNGVPVTIEA